LSDYSHRYHAGNHGDVFKHAALLACLAPLTAAGAPPLTCVDTHAGEGHYRLGSTGEWTEGIGRLDAAGPASSPALTGLTKALARAGAATRMPNRGGEYPGSPRLMHGALRPGDTLVAFERDPVAASALARVLGPSDAARARTGDGFAGLATLAAAPSGGRRLFVHVDPPYTDKAEWSQVVDALATLVAARPDAGALLWYPIKSLTRPNVLHAALRARGVGAAVVELHVTPQEIKRNALHGSGVVLVGVAPAVVEQISALAAALGPLLATHDGRWWTRTLGWSPASTPAPGVAPG
jgi:23S rRNA (adenine2030-N6)-methyltransferase